MSHSPTYLDDRCADELAKLFDEVQQAVELFWPIECGRLNFGYEGTPAETLPSENRRNTLGLIEQNVAFKKASQLPFIRVRNSLSSSKTGYLLVQTFYFSQPPISSCLAQGLVDLDSGFDITRSSAALYPTRPAFRYGFA